MFSSQQERGQGLTEYALIISLVGIVVLTALTLLGPAAGNVYSNIVGSLGGLPEAAAEEEALQPPGPVAFTVSRAWFQVTVQWTALPNADSYTITRTRQNGNSATETATCDATCTKTYSYLNWSLSPLRTITMSASNEAGTGPAATHTVP